MARPWWQTMFWIGLGAALGANARFWLGRWIFQVWPSGFPWATLCINVSGSLLLGSLNGLVGVPQSQRLWAFVAVGFLGSYTTFSTFSVEMLQLWRLARPWAAFVYAAVSVTLGFGAAVLGLWLGSRYNGGSAV